ncbi:MAG: imidazolonepropionase [Sphingomonadales bacterium]
MATTTLITHIDRLVGLHQDDTVLRGAQLAELPTMRNAYLLIEEGTIAKFGSMDTLERVRYNGADHIDAKGGIVLPGWCDSHTHLVFAASREEEFVDKIKGRTYQEIAANGGGILNSARKVAEASEDALFNTAWQRLQEISKMGTTTVEIKSGYGLSVEAELKMLRVIKKLKERSSLQIKATFLGAHAFPLAYKEDHAGYIQLIVEEMLPRIAAEQLADFIDVFCEKGFFSPEQTEQICLAGKAIGLPAKIHGNQLSLSGGVQTAVKLHAISVDHVETMNAAAIECLAGSDTIGTLLPNAAFFLRMSDPPARQLIDAGAAIALASDYNPGSAPSGNMNFVVSQACIRMRMLPEEAINAATINGACALQLQANCGSIRIGKRADLIVTHPVSSLSYLPYAFGQPCIAQVLVNGLPLN